MSTAPGVDAIEQAAFAGWPCLETLADGAWRARFAKGYSKRSNSIQSLDAGDDGDADARLERLSGEYRARGLRPTFRATPLVGPKTLAALDARGWAPFETSLVMTMPVSGKMRAVAGRVQMFAHNDRDWIVAQSAMTGERQTDVFGEILDAVSVPARALLVQNEETGANVAAGTVVVADGIALYYNVVSDPAHRGKGFGRALMHGLLNWAEQAGARHHALQVVGGNPTAIPLYRSLGFAELYSYHYRQEPK